MDLDGLKEKNELTFLVGAKKSLKVKMVFAGYVRQAHPSLKVSLFSNGQHIGDWQVVSSAFQEYEQHIAPEHIKENGELLLDLVIEKPTSPKMLGESEDTRLLGLAVQSVQVEDVKPND